MTHRLVVAPGDQVELHWQRRGGQPTEREVLTRPAAAATHAAVVQLSPWLAHHRGCARVTAAGDCDCGLQAELRQTGWSI